MHCGNLLLRICSFSQSDGYWKLVGQLSKTSSTNVKLQVSLSGHDWFIETAFFLALYTAIRTRNLDAKITADRLSLRWELYSHD